MTMYLRANVSTTWAKAAFGNMFEARALRIEEMRRIPYWGSKLEFNRRWDALKGKVPPNICFKAHSLIVYLKDFEKVAKHASALGLKLDRVQSSWHVELSTYPSTAMKQWITENQIGYSSFDNSTVRFSQQEDALLFMGTFA
jgi:hypothetical protein